MSTLQELKKLGFKRYQGNKSLQAVYLPIGTGFVEIIVEISPTNSWSFYGLAVEGIEATQWVKSHLKSYQPKEIIEVVSAFEW